MLKAYVIQDEVRESQGKKRDTSYYFSFERDEQVYKRLARYRKQGLKVKAETNWWTTTEIKFDKEEKENV